MYKEYTNKDGFEMGRNVSIYGEASTARIWRKIYSNLNESTVRSFKKQYESQKRQANRIDLPGKCMSTNSVNVHVY